MTGNGIAGEPLRFDDEGTLLEGAMKYVHLTYHDKKGHARSRSWHMVLTPTRMFDTYRTLCGRTIVSRDLMDETPSAATCETCYRAKARADEDDPGARTTLP